MSHARIDFPRSGTRDRGVTFDACVRTIITWNVRISKCDQGNRRFFREGLTRCALSFLLTRFLLLPILRLQSYSRARNLLI